VEEVLDYAHANAGRIRQVTEAADRTPVVGQALALRARTRRGPQPVEILMGAVRAERNPYTGEPMMRRLDVKRPERMPEYGTFEATETDRAPRAYLVPPSLATAVERLGAHGVRFRALERPLRLRVEEFAIDSARAAAQPFQGHHERTLFGRYAAAAEREVRPAGAALGRRLCQLGTAGRGAERRADLPHPAHPRPGALSPQEERMPEGDYERIYAVVRRIPKGRVATYGQVAELAGLPGHARQVGYALAAMSESSTVPWHRVINAQGAVSARGPHSGGAVTQCIRLEQEGVEFDARGRVSLKLFGWKGRGSAKVRSAKVRE
jgi:methylated-DNA-protein-cysteine methyltransferase-like protein